MKKEIKVAYRSGVNLTMSCKGHLTNSSQNAPGGSPGSFTECWVGTQPIKSLAIKQQEDLNKNNFRATLRSGFTLIEVLVVVLIIGVLAAVAVPQYQKAVLKSRYSAMMPIAKTIAEGNEVYYMEHGNYSENPAELTIQGKASNEVYADGTSILMDKGDEDGLSFVLVSKSSIPNARYVVYQKHSKNFADTTMCEAEDDRSNELCEVLGGTVVDIAGNSTGDTEKEWTVYLLTGSLKDGDAFPSEEDEGEKCGDAPSLEELAELQQTARTNSGNDELTVTTRCVNGRTKYVWSGGQTFQLTGHLYTKKPYQYAGVEFTAEAGANNGYGWTCVAGAYGCTGATFSEGTACSGNGTNGCVGSIFSGEGTKCSGQTGGCAESTFSGKGSHCSGNLNAPGVCVNSIFSGEGSYCWGNGENDCTGSIFSGKGAHCGSANGSKGCEGAVILGGAYCFNATSCTKALYGTNPEDPSSWGCCNESNGRCPSGVPSCSYDSATGYYKYNGHWHGNYCNPDYLVGGTCPIGSRTSGGKCWDGNGNEVDC